MTIESRQAEIEAVYWAYLECEHGKQGDARTRSTKRGLTHAEKMALIEAGDWRGAGFPSQSEADLFFFAELLRRCSGDAERAEERFRRSPLMRAKWDEPHASDGETYGQMTMRKAQEPQGHRPRSEAQTVKLMDLCSGARLFHSPQGDPFAVVRVNGHLETWGIRTKGLADWLSHEYYKQEGRGPSSNALKETVDTLAARAKYEGDEEETNLRVAGTQEAVYLDLVDPDWRVIEVTADGWRLVKESPVNFIRRPGMKSLPVPAAGGSLRDLQQVLNVPGEEEFCLVVCWLVGTLHPHGPYPLLALEGQQGSAKSVNARLIAGVIDPKRPPLRSVPRSEQDLIIGAQAGWVYGLDNLSSMPEWVADALCRLATGAGLGFRQLYTDDEEKIFEARRPIILNGIVNVANRGDLADRALLVHLPRIPADARRTEEEIEAVFEPLRAGILGALLDAVAEALSKRSSVNLHRAPRMADFASWVVAAEGALPWEPGLALQALEANQSEVMETAIANEPLTRAIVDLMALERGFCGNAQELLSALDSHVDRETRSAPGWPKTAKGLSDALNRIAPVLAYAGVVLQRERESTGRRRRLIHLSVAPDDELIHDPFPGRVLKTAPHRRRQGPRKNG